MTHTDPYTHVNKLVQCLPGFGAVDGDVQDVGLSVDVLASRGEIHALTKLEQEF